MDGFETVCLIIIAVVVVGAMLGAFIYDQWCNHRIKKQKKMHPEYYSRRAENNRAISAQYAWEKKYIDKVKKEIKVLMEVKDYQPTWKREETEQLLENLREDLLKRSEQAKEMWLPIKTERNALNDYAKKNNLWGEGKS